MDKGLQVTNKRCRKRTCSSRAKADLLDAAAVVMETSAGGWLAVAQGAQCSRAAATAAQVAMLWAAATTAAGTVAVVVVVDQRPWLGRVKLAAGSTTGFSKRTMKKWRRWPRCPQNPLPVGLMHLTCLPHRSSKQESYEVTVWTSRRCVLCRVGLWMCWRCWRRTSE